MSSPFRVLVFLLLVSLGPSHAAEEPASPKNDTAELADSAAPEVPVLWQKEEDLPKAADLPVLQNVRFSVIKPFEFDKDGYRFLHGVALAFHNGKLYASFAHNQGGENTDTEEARFRVSDDDGRTWSAIRIMDDGGADLAVSHGVFLSHQGKLWAFMGSYTGTMEGIHTRAYRLNEETGIFEKLGVVLEGGFWPMQEPQRMDDGNWIMAGIKAGLYDETGTHPAAVAISHGEDFTHWDLVPIPVAPGLGGVWGESTVIVEGNRITNISRYGREARALIATSEDYGRTWSDMRPSNLPMATSKPYAGILSTGQRYLVGSTSADGGKRRAPLTIAVSRTGETRFSKVFAIRHALFPEGPGESHERASLSYPYAIEHEGQLYVGYSNNGGDVGRTGQGRQRWNNNSAEMAVIPLTELSLVSSNPSPAAERPAPENPAADAVTIDLARRTWQGIPGVERTEKGRVFVSWFTGGAKEPEPENTCVLSYSDDGGETFTPPEAIALPTSDGTRTFDPTLWIDPRGRLWYIYNRGNRLTGQHDVWARICEDPDAKAPVFGEEFRLGFDAPHSFRMNKPTVLSNGDWAMPVTHAAEVRKEHWFAGPGQIEGVAISSDEGQTWKLHGALKSPEWALEGMVTELKDGRLWLLIRTGSGFLWESHSADQGRTWSEAKPSKIASPGSRFFIRRLASGNLLLVNHYKFTGRNRSHLTAQISTDDGVTWNEGLLLDERGGRDADPKDPMSVPLGGVSYPDGVQDRDGLIWITYDRDRGGAGEILLARFTEEDVLAGQDVSGKVRLKQVVNKLAKPLPEEMTESGNRTH